MASARRSPEELFAAARDGDRSALARLLSLIERGGPDARTVGRLSHPLSGGAYMVGITGAPGAGKSTLTSAVITHLRALELEVAVLAIDPSSPFTGGAILGDRVRMQEHATDPGVFIRSMATRGHLGGLTLATPEAVRLLDAVGREWVMVETVGVGQVEVEIAGKADTTVVVVNPGWGDSVQANKAGLMEIADVFVINKADRKGTDQTRRDLEQMLDLGGHAHAAGHDHDEHHREPGHEPGHEHGHEPGDEHGHEHGHEPGSGTWRPPIVATVGTTGEGVDELWDAVLAHRAHAETSGLLEQRRTARLRDELREIVAERLRERSRELCSGQRWDQLTDDVVAYRTDPWSAADEMLAPVDA